MHHLSARGGGAHTDLVSCSVTYLLPAAFIMMLSQVR